MLAEIDPLSQEKVTSVEAEYRGVFWNDLSFNLIAYNSWYRNFISPQTVVAGPDPAFHPTADQPTYGFQDGELVDPFGLFTYYNFDEAVIRGLDVGLNYSLAQNLTLSGGVSLIEQTQATEDDFLPSLSLNVPKTKVKGSLLIENVGIDNYFLRFTGRWKASHEFRASYSVPGTGLKIKGSATNLLDTRVPDKLGAPQTGRLVSFSATYTLEGPNL